MLWAGVDLGTTHLKALLYDDTQRRVLDVAIAPTPTLRDGQLTSHDADQVVLTALGLLAGILAGGDRARLLAGVGVSGVGEEIVTLDGDDRPTGPVLAWYDPRGQEEADTLAAGAPPRLHRRLAMDASYSLFKLLWLRRHRPDEFARIRRVLDPSGYLLLRLGARATMDWSHASRTALFDPWTTAWDAETLGAAQLPGSSLPELVPSGTIVGTASSSEAVTAGIPAGTPLVIGGHDHLCGAYASGVREPGDLYVSAGTSEAQLVVLPGAPESNVSTLNLDLGRYVDETHWYLHLGRPLGHTYRQWRRLLFGEIADDVVETEIEGSHGAAAGILFEPAGLGVGGSLAGVMLTANRGSILRAIVEGSAIASGEMTRTLETAAGAEAATIVVSGHAARSALWLRLRAGMTRRPLQVVRQPETAALGAALLAQRAVTGGADGDAVGRTAFVPSDADVAAAASLKRAYADWERGSARDEVRARGPSPDR